MTDPSRIAGLSAAKRALLEQRMRDRSDHHRHPRSTGPVAPVLSFAQERLWVLGELSPELTAYNTVRAVQLDGTVDPDRLRAAMAAVTMRHDVLRTRVRRSHDGSAEAVVADSSTPSVETRSLGPDEVPRDAIAEFAARPFDLARDDLVRALIITAPGQDEILVLVVHHIASDEGSRSILWRELDEAYSGRVLPALEIQYAEHARRERDEFERSEVQADLHWWTEHLAGALRSAELPTDFRRPPRQSHNGARRRLPLAGALTDALRAVARAQGTTLFAAVLTGFAWTLSRWTDSDEVVLGMPVSGRDRRDTRDLIGLLVNTVVLRVDCSGSPSFAELLERVRRALVAALEHQAAPFDKVVEALAPPRDLSRNPLFQVLVNGVSADQDGVFGLGELTARPLDFDGSSNKFDLGLLVAERDGAAEISLEYATDLFAPPTIPELGAQVVSLLHNASVDAATPLAELDVLTDEQRRRLTVDVNATQAPIPDGCLHELFAAAASQTPDAPAVADETTSLSYRQLDERANALARHLVKLGVGPDVPVAVVVRRSVQMEIAVLAVLKAGGAYVPLDTDYPADRIEFIVDDCKAPVMITEADLPAARTTNAQVVLVNDLDDILATTPTTPPDVATDPAQLAYIIYTSGSTGRPKGVQVEHRGVVNRIAWMQRTFTLTAADTVLQKTPLTFDVSVWEVLWPLLFGARLFLARPDGHRDPRYLRDIVLRERVSVMHFVPSMLDVFLDVESSSWCADVLRAVMCSGEALAFETKELFFARMPEVELHNLYGPTEASIDVTWSRCLPGPRHQVVIGSPIDNVQVYVVDAHGRPVPPGIPGELLLAGVQLARGYVGRPDLTAERFVASTLAPDGRVYHTGDLVRWASDGQLSYLGRIDRQVKLRGFRVEPAEIESVINESPLVLRCAVVLAALASGESALAAYVVVADAAGAPDEDVVAQLMARMRSRLPDYMVPTWVRLLPDLPVNANGKLDHARLPPPVESSPGERTPPRTASERAVAKVWTDLLGIDDVGVHDDFFRLGGHSLLAVRLVSAVARDTGVTLDLPVVFENPTVAGLAGLVDAGGHGQVGAGPLRIDRTQRRVNVARLTGLRAAAAGEYETDEPTDATAFPLTSAQERMWLLEQLDTDRSTYLVRRAFRASGPLNLPVLQRALDALVERHDSLRTVLTTDDGEPIGVVTDAGRWPLEHHAVGSEQAAQAAVDVAGRVPFDLAAGPLARADLYPLDDGTSLVVLTVHHSVVDGWSMEVLLEELAVLYAADGAAQRPPHQNSLQYPDYAVWLRQAVDETAMQAQLDHWTQRLAGAPPMLELPTDRPRRLVETKPARRYTASLGTDLTAAVRGLARDHTTTPFAVLYAGCAVVLGRLAGQDDVIAGTVVAGRSRPEIARTVGLFVNTLVLRVDTSGSPSFHDMVERSAATVRDALAHQDLPFERLVEELQPERELGRNPVFQVMINLQPGEQEDLQLGRAKLRPYPVEATFARFDLSLVFAEAGEELMLTVEYDSDLFDASSAQTWLDRVREVLAAACEAPATTIDELPVVRPGEHDALVRDGTGRVGSVPRSALELIAETVGSRPDHLAVVSPGHQPLSYRELWRRAALVGARVASRVAPGSLVGIQVSRSPALLVGALGVWLAGCAYVPIDPAYPAERIAFMRDDAGLAIVLGDDELAAAVAGTNEPQPSPVSHAGGLDDLAYVIYTSGSTGTPKGVAIEHRALANLLTSMAREPGAGPGDVMIAVTTFSFDIAALELFLPLITGGTVVIVATETAADPGALATLISDSGATMMQATPSTYRMLLDAGWVGASLRALCGGEALPADIAARLLPSVTELWNCYGPTETTIWSTIDRVVDPSNITIGRPIDNTVAYVLDSRRRLVPPGTKGELWLGGTGLARGYLHRAELTADRFVADPLRPGHVIYRTGDIATWTRSGQLRAFGRSDNQVKLRGHRIELGEIEVALQAVPGVDEAAVVVHDEVLVAYCVGNAEHALRRLRDVLPEYMVPNVLVHLAVMPRTPNGKTDRAALPAPTNTTVGGRAPSSASERLVADVWGPLLGTRSPSVEDEFFANGGHSLLATRLVARLSAALDRPVALRTLFEHPTLGELAAALDRDSQDFDDGPVPLPRDRHAVHADDLADRDVVAAAAVGDSRAGIGVSVFPMSSAQERMWLLHRIAPGDPTQLVLIARRLPGGVDPTRLRAALESIVDRHEILRTTYQQLDDLLVQVVHPRLPPDFEVVNPGNVTDESVLDHLRVATGHTFDLTAGPVLRARLVQPDGDDPVLVLSTHHITLDGWSIDHLLGELATEYDDPARGAVRPGPVLQFGDYARWERDRPLNTADREFWLRQLDRAPSSSTIASTCTEPGPKDRGRRLRRTLPAYVSTKVDQLAREHSATAFMVHVAALTALLNRHGAGDDVTVGTPVVTRAFAGGESLIGPLINTLALRVGIADSATFGSHLDTAVEVCRAAFAHGTYPFEILVGELDVERDPDRHPLFQVLITSQEATPIAADSPGLTLEPIDIDWQVPHFDLRWSLTSAAGSTELLLEYRCDRYDAAYIEWLVDGYLRLLSAAVTEPARPLAELPVIGEDEQQALSAWEGEDRPGPDPSLPDLVTATARTSPQRSAVIYADTALSFEGLSERADAVAAALVGAGVSPGDRVAIALGHGIEWPVAVFGAWRAGASFVPIDPQHPAIRRALMLTDSGSRVVLTDDAGSVEFDDDVQVIRVDDLPPGRPPSSAPTVPEAEAYVIYTSGSTGVPKGVQVRHGELAAYARAQYDALYAGRRDTDRLRVAVNSSTSFDFSINQLVHLGYGSTLLPIPDDVRLHPPAMIDYLSQHAVDVLDATPTHMSVLVAAGLLDSPAPPSTYLVGGESIDAQLWTRLREAEQEMQAVYGPTETTIIVCGASYADSPRPTIGRPYGGVVVRVVDQLGQRVPVGAPGELWLSGRQVAAGYLNRISLTRECFVETEGRRWYRSGDVVRFGTDGLLEYLGRTDDQVKIRGHRIELGEVVSALTSLVSVSNAAVVAHDGELIAAVVMAPTATFAPATIRHDLRATLPASMIPSTVVEVQRIPLTPSGKLDREAVITAERPDEARANTGASLAGPGEELVAELIGSLLGVAVTSPDDDFFDLGGNSLLATRLISQLGSMDIDLPLMTVFTHSTVGQLAHLVTAALLADLDDRRD